MKLASYIVVMFAFVCEANMYNDWAQKNAVNLIKSVDSSRADLAEEQKTCISKPDNQFRMLVNKASKAKEAVYNNAWSGTRKDLEAVVRDAEHSYGFENAKHLGRNATMLVPATLDEMRKEIRLGNPNHWEASSYDGAHGSNANSDDNLVEMLLKKYNNGVSKFIIPEKRGNVLNKDRGREVVYDNVTGKITTNEKMGTWNFGSKNGFISTMRGPHRTKDMDPHATKADKANQFERDGDQYKYVGILYERDPNNPDKYYIIDGRTGLPMTPQQVAEMPTTLSDMWKDMGLVCVSNDAKDMIEPDLLRDEAKSAIDTVKRETRSTKSDSNDVSTANIANQKTVTVDNLRHGVRGWCDCGDDHGKRYIVGDMFCMYDKLECDLAYTLCGRCGCVVRPKDCAGEGLKIMDVKLYKELKQKNGGKLAWSDAFDSLKARQSKIDSIPNGQIVVGGLCTCKFADPISVGFTNKIIGEFYVCCNCGRVREPDENGDVPSGPTALSEMGLNEQAEKESERILNWLGEGKSLK